MRSPSTTPTHAPVRTPSIALAIAATAAAIGLTSLSAAPANTAAASTQPDEAAMRLTYTVVIPAGTYQSIVVSPRDSAAGAARSIPFVIRSRDAAGQVSDLAFYIPPGQTQQLDFPTGLTLAQPAALFAPDEVRFAAWGVVGTRPIRFDPLRLDANDDAAARARIRAYESFLRELDRER